MWSKTFVLFFKHFGFRVAPESWGPVPPVFPEDFKTARKKKKQKFVNFWDFLEILESWKTWKKGVFDHHNSTPIKIDENSQSQEPKIDVYQIPHPKYVQKLPYIRKIFNEIAIPLHNFWVNFTTILWKLPYIRKFFNEIAIPLHNIWGNFTTIFKKTSVHTVNFQRTKKTWEISMHTVRFQLGLISYISEKQWQNFAPYM